MNETRYAGRVGAFIVVAIILIAALLLVFSKGLGWFTPSYSLRLRADHVGGLKPRSAVLVSGVVVGSVTDAELAPDGKGVTILLRIQKRYGIHRDARFVVEQVGLLGDQFVVVYPTDNKAPLLQEGDEVDCASPLNFQEVARSTIGFIQRVDETVRVLNEAITRVNTLVLDELTLTNIAAGVRNLRAASEDAHALVENLNRLVTTNTSPVTASITNLTHFTEELNRLAAEVGATVKENRAGLASVVQNMENASQTLGRVAKDLDAGRGVVGSLLKDEQLQLTVSNLLGNLAVAASNVATRGLLFKPKPPKEKKK